MTVLAPAQLTRHVTIQRATLIDDLAGGQTLKWTSLGTIPCRIGTVSSRRIIEYRREGYENVYSIQAVDLLPERMEGTRSLYRLLFTSGTTRARFMLDGVRTLSILAVSFVGLGSDPANSDLIRIDVAETPQPVGYMDAS